MSDFSELVRLLSCGYSDKLELVGVFPKHAERILADRSGCAQKDELLGLAHDLMRSKTK